MTGLVIAARHLRVGRKCRTGSSPRRNLYPQSRMYCAACRIRIPVLFYGIFMSILMGRYNAVGLGKCEFSVFDSKAFEKTKYTLASVTLPLQIYGTFLMVFTNSQLAIYFNQLTVY